MKDHRALAGQARVTRHVGKHPPAAPGLATDFHHDFRVLMEYVALPNVVMHVLAFQLNLIAFILDQSGGYSLIEVISGL
jgi:hypothetical protein